MSTLLTRPCRTGRLTSPVRPSSRSMGSQALISNQVPADEGGNYPVSACPGRGFVRPAAPLRYMSAGQVPLPRSRGPARREGDRTQGGARSGSRAASSVQSVTGRRLMHMPSAPRTRPPVSGGILRPTEGGTADRRLVAATDCWAGLVGKAVGAGDGQTTLSDMSPPGGRQRCH